MIPWLQLCVVFDPGNVADDGRKCDPFAWGNGCRGGRFALVVSRLTPSILQRVIECCACW
jgi:hypothetical protein